MSDDLANDSMSQTRARARATLDRVRDELLRERTPEGHWVGFLSPSALSTATAISAMAAVVRFSPPDDDSNQQESALRRMIDRGIDYLRGQQNKDGGFGDTDRSHSNIATSYLVLSASTLAEQIGQASLSADAIQRLHGYLDQAGRLAGLKQRYGKDKTFVVPIMNNMAIAGLISWDEVAALPFEAAVFPQSMYRFLRMPVVSYAIPALVAIGQARHFLGKRTWFPIRWIRSASVKRTLNVLLRMQPASGGYLEATPLTAFVVMSLAATQRCDLAVVKNGLKFLKDSMLPDGSWPIDTNLATWVTSLSIQALACDPDDDGQWYSESLARWHLGCQHQQRHPFTGADPGGWGWTDLSGAVPDCDDTPAAVLATELMRPYASNQKKTEIGDAQTRAIKWINGLQNRNGGWPTFCRGWGKLPFDRSSTDLTAHAIRALHTCLVRETETDFDQKQLHKDSAISAGLRFLEHQQNNDGSWMPLWFGNQDRNDESNPIYGTAKVLLTPGLPKPLAGRGVEFLIDSQNDDGGWGGGSSVAEKLASPKNAADLNLPGIDSANELKIPAGLTSSVEETALAVEALCMQFNAAGPDRVQAAILGGVDFLVQSVQDSRHRVAWPIGFYFAKLWYHERLYPLIFTVAALGRFLAISHPPNAAATQPTIAKRKTTLGTSVGD